MDISIFLAKIIGLYFLIVSISMLINAKLYKTLFLEFFSNDSIMLFSAVFTLLIGILLVVSHNIWTADWRVVITILAWLTLFKGIIRLAFPLQSKQFNIQFISNNQAYMITSGVILLLGAFLCYYGFM